ncbi:hypothetical protein CR156_06735 [Stenotrophomonas lactitubi]|jgi:hypothetical protein|uniref:hypothetical protein n=1 Tax=Stenotrophomonas TaxID=40323 RepID=UPI000C27AFBD|nr:MULTISPECIES: hypothetical protein [Stenotrophomonas]MBD3682201.1 hypothetical protein [Stenotrophomonas sp. Br8]PJO51914.1 hypothetical protein CR156_06735 [Stenotrophomonas lactitubi]
MLKKAIFASVIFFASTGAASAQAVAAAQCEGCSDQQMQEAARGEIDFGPVSVFSLSTGDIRSYLIMPNLKMSEIATPADLAEYYAQLVYLYQSNGNSLEFRVTVNQLFGAGQISARSARVAAAAATEYPQSAYEALADSSKMNSIHEMMRWKYPSLIAGANSVYRVFNPVAWLNPQSAQVTVRLEFPDQSSMMITYNYGTKLWEKMPNTARDAHNNSIPEDTSAFAGGGVREYNFNGAPSSDLVNFLYWADRHGIHVSGATRRDRLACSIVVGGTTRCVSF